MSNIQKQHKISPAIAWLTIQKFIIFYCPLDGEHTNCRFGERGSFNIKIYNRSCRSSIFLYVILKKRELTLETELQVLFVCSQKLQDEMMIKQTYFGQEALHKLSCRIYLAISQKNYRYKK